MARSKLRFRAAPLLLAMLGLGCGIDDALQGAPCENDDDCPALTCVRTAAEKANEEPGTCSEDDSCVRGEQEGCQATTNGGCVNGGLVPATADDGTTFCCAAGSGSPSVISVADDGTAVCFDCPTCSSGQQEPCKAGDARCEVEEGAPCGCRTTDAALVGDPCETDEDCGAATCVRTLEQEAEPNEPLPVDQPQEPGQCRPADMPACAGGSQVGCLLPPGEFCGGATQEVDVDSLSFCCPEPSNSSEFRALVYQIAGDQSSVACTACARSGCDDAAGNLTAPQCTLLSDPECEVDPGALCGCAPAPMG